MLCVARKSLSILFCRTSDYIFLRKFVVLNFDKKFRHTVVLREHTVNR